VNIDRREFIIGTGALALAGAVLFRTLPDFVGQALAQDFPAGELLKEGPLEEMSQGDAKAPVTLIEYASMTCPHCATFHETTYPVLKTKYIDTGKVRFIFREFPLDQLAAAGFMLARCAGKDKYFPIIETLFGKQNEWVVRQPLPPLLAIAKQAGFTEQSFEACLANQKLLDDISAVRERATKQFNVQSTPTFFINGKLVRGGLTVAELDKQLEPYLKGQ
jgi:protein-disulfide isomerase